MLSNKDGACEVYSLKGTSERSKPLELVKVKDLDKDSELDKYVH